MFRNTLLKIHIILIITLFHAKVFAQEATVVIGKKSIALDEPFIMKLIIKSNTIQNKYPPLPEIPGMTKRDVSSTITTQTVKGQSQIVQTIIQNYFATKEGTFILPPFSLTVNEKTVQGKEITIIVGPPKDPFYTHNNDLYDELLELEKRKNEYVDIEADAFFALSTDKDQVYVGEGFVVTLALYVAETNKAELESYKVGEQLIEILKKIRPVNCWEENFNIAEFRAVPVTIKGKKYTRYAIYQAAYYPLNTKPVFFPEVKLIMIKYRVARDPELAAKKKKEDFRTFITTSKSVHIKELPPHPLKEQVSVGNYRLKEGISNRQLHTGKSFKYELSITGEGNITAIDLKPVTNNASFDFYPPVIKENISHANDKVSGSKTFTYSIVPKEPGLYVLRNYFEWIYFNTQKEKYDTLSSSITLQVTGESQKNAGISLKELGPLYKNMMRESNQMKTISQPDRIKSFANLFILLMLLATVVLFFVKR